MEGVVWEEEETGLVSRARPDRKSLGSPREVFGFDSGSAGSHLGS